VLRLLDELEQLVDNGKYHVFGKVVIDEQAFFVQTSKLKKSLPENIKKADRIEKDSERMVSGAQTEAQRLVSDAQTEAQTLIGDARSSADRTIQDARSHSDRIIEDARREAERIVADSQQHAEQLVAEHVITQQAQHAGTEIHEGAIRDSEEMRRQADAYAFSVLDKVSAMLQRLGDGVEEGKEQIRQNQR